VSPDDVARTLMYEYLRGPKQQEIRLLQDVQKEKKQEHEQKQQ